MGLVRLQFRNDLIKRSKPDEWHEKHHLQIVVIDKHPSMTDRFNTTRFNVCCADLP